MQVKEIDVDTLQQKMTTKEDIILYDIRSESEVIQGVLPDSKYLPMHLIPLKIADFPKDKEIILYCRSGVRSYHACKFLMQEGFDKVINLKGGIIAWARSGYDIVEFTRQTG